MEPMTELTILDPADPGDAGPRFDRNGVRRSRDGRPYVKSPCPLIDGDEVVCHRGRVQGKRPGTTKQCPKCKGKGFVEELYSRCTSFVGALESRDNLEKWQRRITILGLAVDPLLWAEVLECDPDDRDTLNAIAERAFEAGDGHAAAQKGTDLHELTEYVDRGEALPAEVNGSPVTLTDRADMAAYVRTRDAHGLTFLGMEQFVVCDRYKIGGTFDRIAVAPEPSTRCRVCDDLGTDQLPKVFDLKTGRVDYGQGKIAQQLAVYANSERYDPETGERSPLDVCPHVGLVMHLPQGTGTATLYTVDLVAGWEDVALSDKVREHRRVTARAGSRLQPLDSGLLIDMTTNPKE